MRRKHFVLFLVVGFWSVSCSSGTNTNHPSPQTHQTDATTAASKNPEIDRDAAAQNEANAFMIEWAARRFAQCRGNVYWIERSRGSVAPMFFECRNMQAPMVFGNVIKPRELTDADKLNGVDPQPKEWDGQVDFWLHTCRFAFPNENWKPWGDLVHLHALLQKSKGRWALPEMEDKAYIGLIEVPNLDCQSVDRYLAAQQKIQSR